MPDFSHERQIWQDLPGKKGVLKKAGLVPLDITCRRTSCFSSFSIGSGSQRILRILLLLRSDDLSKKKFSKKRFRNTDALFGHAGMPPPL